MYGTKDGNNVVMFLFYEIYHITFVNKFNFESYITRWENNFHIIHGLEIFKMQMRLKGHKHTKPPKNCNDKYNLPTIIFCGNVWTSHLGLFLFVLTTFD